MAEYVCEVVTEHELCGDVHHYVRHERVVRCRDCGRSCDCEGETRCEHFHFYKVDPDGFCAWGEPREGD